MKKNVMMVMGSAHIAVLMAQPSERGAGEVVVEMEI